MDLSNFWIYIRYEDAATDGIGFELFSKAHLIWLAVLALMTIIYVAAYRFCNEKGRDHLRKGMALFLIFYEFAKQCFNSLAGVPHGVYLPLEICSLAEYTILIDAMWPRSKVTKHLLAFAFLPASFMALMMPSCNIYPPISFFSLHQFLMHAGIFAYIVALLVADELKPRYRGIWISIIIICILIIPVYQINAHFDQDYMFLLDPEGNSILQLVWNLSGGSGGLPYIIGLIILVAIVMHIFYGLFKLIDLARGKFC